MSLPASSPEALSAVWPPEACRPPSWTRWEWELSSGRRVTATSPLAEFHEWAQDAHERVELFGIERAAEFGQGWLVGARRAPRHPAPPASLSRPASLFATGATVDGGGPS
jgi:hypothetical protein